MSAALAMSLLVTGAALSGCVSSPQSRASSSGTGQTWTVASPGQTKGGASGPAVPATGRTSAPGSPGQGAATGTAVGSVPPGLSQSQADATRDGVQPAVAALALQMRIHQVPPTAGATKASTVEGVWLVSRPDPVAGAPAGYGELLLLDRSGERIRRAYPFMGLTPQWMVITQRAIFVGRHGDGGSPDAMIGRIDRTTGELEVRVVPDRQPVVTSLTESDTTSRPGVWTIDSRNFLADLGRPPQSIAPELVFPSHGPQPLRMDPETLQVIGS
jgi:hypothetical protein